MLVALKGPSFACIDSFQEVLMLNHRDFPKKNDWKISLKSDFLNKFIKTSCKQSITVFLISRSSSSYLKSSNKLTNSFF